MELQYLNSIESPDQFVIKTKLPIGVRMVGVDISKGRIQMESEELDQRPWIPLSMIFELSFVPGMCYAGRTPNGDIVMVELERISPSHEGQRNYAVAHFKKSNRQPS